MAQFLAVVPGAHCVALYDVVGGFPGQPLFLHQRQQHALAENQPPAAFQVAPHPVGIDPQPADHLGKDAQNIVQHQAGVGQDDAFRGGMADVPLAPQGDIFQGRNGVAADGAGQAANPLGEFRVALVGH